MRLAPLIFAMIAGLTAAPLVRAQDSAVDLQLVLAVDSSSSVSMDEFYLQLEGYAAAFRHPELLRAIQSGPSHAIAVTLVEWSGARQHIVNFEWRRLSTAEDLEGFAKELVLAPRLISGGETAIGDAVDFSMSLFAESDYIAERRVIDVSGDGASNRGRSAAAARADALAHGVVINGLAILNEEPNLDGFYTDYVAGGPGAFVMTATDYQDFAGAILRKLLREVELVADASVR